MIEEIVGSVMEIAYAAAKTVAELLLSLPWWMASLVVLAAGFLVFLAYQQSEHSITSFITRSMVYIIVFGVVVFAILAYLNASGGIPGI